MEFLGILIVGIPGLTAEIYLYKPHSLLDQPSGHQTTLGIVRRRFVGMIDPVKAPDMFGLSPKIKHVRHRTLHPSRDFKIADPGGQFGISRVPNLMGAIERIEQLQLI